MTRGGIPYPTVEAVNIIHYLSEGNRMQKPASCPSKLSVISYNWLILNSSYFSFKTVETCWLDSHEERPTFTELVDITKRIYRNAKRTVDEAKEQGSRDDSRREATYQNAQSSKPPNSRFVLQSFSASSATRDVLMM